MLPEPIKGYMNIILMTVYFIQLLMIIPLGIKIKNEEAHPALLNLAYMGTAITALLIIINNQ